MNSKGARPIDSEFSGEKVRLPAEYGFSDIEHWAIVSISLE
jgi:hypothetical protein